MSVSKMAKAFFRHLDETVGPFDRPFQFRVFPFDAGGEVNLLTVGDKSGGQFMTYVTWDLFGQNQQKRGSLGRYELMAVCDNAGWCADVLTRIGRLGLQELFEPGDTLDLASWISPNAPIQGVVFDEAHRTDLRVGLRRERCGLLRCVGITRPELEYALKHGGVALIERLKDCGVHPRTILNRLSIELSP